MIGLIIALCHVFGTLYYLLAKIEIELNVRGNWLEVLNLIEAEWYENYIESFYWALATFLLVGSKGDTSIETVFCICVLLVTICAFAYILQTI